MTCDLFSLDCDCGCAAKVPADELAGLLKDLDLPQNPDLLVGPETMDDAGVYRVFDDNCLVQTVDFFPPVARDPYAYGQIAAANSLSDVYAMGGKPITALVVACFPVGKLDPSVFKDITRGAVDKLREAGTVLMGGHSVVDKTLKYGLAITGMIRRDMIMDNAHARPGDALILTKPLGTGVTIMAIKAGLASAAQEQAVNASMCSLNMKASILAAEAGVRACTDITGFGLLGHAGQMARASGSAMEFFFADFPLLEGVRDFAAMGLLSAAAYSNLKYMGKEVVFDANLSQAEKDLCFDPQTSGGLLLCCPPEKSAELLSCLKADLATPCAVVGRVMERGDGSMLRVRKSDIEERKL